MDWAHLLPFKKALVKVRVIRTGLRMTCSLVLEDILHQPFSFFFGAFRGGGEERPEQPGSSLTEAGHTTTLFNHSRERARGFMKEEAEI